MTKWTVGAACLIMLGATPSTAQVAMSGYSLPASLAVEAALEAIRACEAVGSYVTATVVNQDGVIKTQIRGDHASILGRDSSFQKAYTLISIGVIYRMRASSEFAAMGAKRPVQLPEGRPNIVYLAGAVAIQAGDETVATIGVGGSPGGDKDEVCARAGADKIASAVAEGLKAFRR